MYSKDQNDRSVGSAYTRDQRQWRKQRMWPVQTHVQSCFHRWPSTSMATVLNKVEVEYELGVLIIWTFFRLQRDPNPRPSAYKSRAITTRPPSPQQPLLWRTFSYTVPDWRHVREPVIGPRPEHSIFCKIACAPIENSDRPAHLGRL